MTRARYARSPIVVVPVGDLHIGSSVALCHPDGIVLEDGGRYMPNAAQVWLWRQYDAILARVRELRKRRVHVVTVFMGEFVDGRHHETTQLASQAPEIQAAAALDVVMPLATMSQELYVMRGTDAHSGHGAASDYAIGRELGAVRDQTGQAAYYKLRLDVGGVLFDIAHHVSGGGDDVRLYGNAIKRETAAMLFEDPAINIVLRGHVHRYADTGEAFGLTRWGMVVPAWQLKTSFTHRITRREDATVGTHLIHIESGAWSRERLMWTVPPAPTVQAKINSTLRSSTPSSAVTRRLARRSASSQ